MPVDLATLRLAYVRRVVSTLAGMLGVRGAIAFARWLARGVFDLDTPARRRAGENIARVFAGELDDVSRDRLVRRTFENIAAFWCETLLLKRTLRESSWRTRVEFENQALVESVAASSRGALLVTGYFGNLAACVYALGRHCKPLHAIIDQAQHPVLRSWQDELYRQPDLRLLTRQDARNELRGLLSAGRKVFVVGEHSRPRGRAVVVPFLGGSRRCYPTIGSLARWCEVPVYVVTARRTGWDSRFAVSCELAADPRDCPDEADPTDWITHAYMARLESRIRQCPEQYLWTRVWEAASQSADRS